MSQQRRKRVPLRSCIVCQKQRPKRELVRIVHTPEATIEVDPKGKRPGRGAYLCLDRECWEADQLQRRLGQALRCQLTAEAVEELKADAAALLTERAAAAT